MNEKVVKQVGRARVRSTAGRAIAAGIVLLGLLGCPQVNAPDLAIAQSRPVTVKTKQAKPVRAIDPRLINANTQFGFKLFSEILQQEGNKNVFVSPSSVAIALAMTYTGATGETQQAMAKTLELQGMSLPELNQAYADLKTSLENADPNVQLQIANSLWAKKGVPFNPEFIQINQKFYGAEVNELNFSDASATNRINNWVSQNTNGKIPQIVDKLNPDDILFLVNAIYFKGDWAKKFEKNQTTNQPFYLSDGTSKNHPLMSQRGEYRYYETEQFQAVSLPYDRGRLSFYVFLPKPDSNLKAFSEQLNAQNWEQWMAQFRTREGTIKLPRFKMEYGIELQNILKSLGMEVAFDPEQADFSKMSSANPSIDRVKHKTFVEVNEEGTEAAAATSVGIRATSVQIPQEPFQMVVNRPFFAAIRDNQTGSILFMGNIVDPKLKN